MEKSTLLPGAEPFYYLGSKAKGHIGCLVIHGFTGVPGDVRQLGAYLAEQGYTVFGPRLTHHGNVPADLNRSEWHDWYLSALGGLHLLRQMRCRQIVPVGLSMGGDTALLLSAWEKVTAVVSMSAPVFFNPDWRLNFARIISYVYPFAPKSPLPPDQKFPTDEFERRSYEVNPVRGVGELLRYFEVVKEALAEVTVPAFLIHSRRDLTAPPENMDYIYDLLGSEIKERLWLDESSHVITESVEKDILFPAVAKFIAQHTDATMPESEMELPTLDANWREIWRTRWNLAVSKLMRRFEKEEKEKTSDSYTHN